MSAEVIPLDQSRNARALITLLVDGAGIDAFLEAADRTRIDERSTREALSLAAVWLERRTGETPAASSLAFMRRELRAMLERRLAERLAQARS